MKNSILCVAVVLTFLSCADNTTTVREEEPPRCPDAPVVHTGSATYYSFADGGGNCLFDPTPNDLMVGAMNTADYDGSNICGSCVRVTGPHSSIVIRIVDRCPECAKGWIDLSPLAFQQLADTSEGVVPISWEVVPCDVTGPIEYHFIQGSNQWWTAVQIRNHRNPVLSLEYLTPNGFVGVFRRMYNYFVDSTGMGPGPFTFRVTDVYGHTLVDSGIVHRENASVPGRAQFPQCPQ